MIFARQQNNFRHIVRSSTTMNFRTDATSNHKNKDAKPCRKAQTADFGRNGPADPGVVDLGPTISKFQLKKL
jgi:hypothetical protein